MRYRDVLKVAFFEFISVREEYRLRCGAHHMRSDLVFKYIENQLLLIYPICPHFADMVYSTIVLAHHP